MLVWRKVSTISAISLATTATATATFNRGALLSRCSSSSSVSAGANGAEVTEPPKIVLYQYQICPFCSRVKSYLQYLKIPYQSIEVNPLTKSQIKFSKEYKKVPLAVIDNEVVAESKNIIDSISALARKRNNSQLSTSFLSEDTEKWSEWSEKRLAVMLYPNITRSMAESWECFGYTENVSEWSAPTRLFTRAVGTVFMAGANGKIKKKYGIVDERKELDIVLKEWTDSLQGKYLHGNQVTMPDIMVYGVLNAINKFQTFNDIMADNERLRVWFDDVKSSM
jgi:microsomal prostaglandin-E synthase 2